MFAFAGAQSAPGWAPISGPGIIEELDSKGSLVAAQWASVIAQQLSVCQMRGAGCPLHRGAHMLTCLTTSPLCHYCAEALRHEA